MTINPALARNGTYYSINPASGNFPYADGFTVHPNTYEKSFGTGEEVNLRNVSTLEKESHAFAIPSSFSSARQGFAHHTFLGASVRSFSVNGGFGDSASNMSIELVEDEFNKSDGKGLGDGADPYHNGVRDIFSPPKTGSPVFFNFGKTLETINNSFAKVYDDLYEKEIKYYLTDRALKNYKPYSTPFPGGNHFNFGGILQSATQNRGTGGNPVYSAQVTDPREILSNVVLVMNNYTGTTYNNKNLYNLYGFLEYNPTPVLKKNLKSIGYESIFRKIVNADGSYYYTGYDMYSAQYNPSSFDLLSIYNPNLTFNMTVNGGFPPRFPITGTGMARRCDQGIPFYRIRQALSALLGIDGPLPAEYVEAGFGGYINFRGFNYIVDLGGLQEVPDYYFFDFDQMNLLDFCLEICDITSSDLFVTLLPMIPHPVSNRFLEYNNYQIENGTPQNMIAGIIKVDSIDRSFQPQPGAIKSYIDTLLQAGAVVENSDVGYELSNVVTDKFIAGAQQVEMYYFNGACDRDNSELNKLMKGADNQSSRILADQWTLSESLSQQILPFYGFLGKDCVTIPKGFGSYQQIMFDSSTWSVNGIGNYYVATEMELRAALISYERWSDFLMMYNDVYMESLEADDAVEGAAVSQTAPPQGWPATLPPLSTNFAVTVPRSVFTSDNNLYGADKLPVNVCNPPYGYPLYYKRATRLGVQGAGLTDIQSKTTRILTALAELKGAALDGTRYQEVLDSIWKDIEFSMGGNLSQAEADYIDLVKGLIESGSSSGDEIAALIDNFASGLTPIIKATNRLAKKTSENAKKAYNYIKKIADENFGKKFLVKIPNRINYAYSPIVKINPLHGEIMEGPFGFRPLPINSNPLFGESDYFKSKVEFLKNMSKTQQSHIPCLMRQFVQSETDPSFANMALVEYFEPLKGALEVNYNPLIDNFEFNYEPSKQGGYVENDLFANIALQKFNPAISQGLFPQDLENFINDNNRLSAYARFNHSQDLAFDLLSEGSFTQQVMVAGHFIPDVSDVLDNTKTEENKFQRFPNADDLSDVDTRPPTVAFVKCDLDEKFYMIPPVAYQQIAVHGSKVRDHGRFSMPVRVWDSDLCEFVSGFRYWEPHFVPLPTTMPDKVVNRLDFVRNNLGHIITQKEYQNTDHVYALITLPGRVLPVADKRFRDGIFQEKNAQYLKHFLTQDVVKLPEFESPAYSGRPSNILARYGSILDPGAVGGAISAFQKAMEGLDFAFPNRINVTSPSPVYPDMVALPLLSKERCYGPWLSSILDYQSSVYSNIGGKVEFVKDENLAPWNYNGYDLMNEAGILQAQFSNSLLLSTERGGLVYPGAPSGITLGRFLQEAGPLVTSVSVDVSDAGVKTTCKMDLYTASFGKLHKQKQDAVSKISRERQKIKDERNALIRKGLGKAQKSINYNLIYDQIKSLRVSGNSGGDYRPMNSITGQSSSVNTGSAVPGYSAPPPLFGASSSNNVMQQNFSASVGDDQETADFASNYPDRQSLSSAYYNTASTSIKDMWIAASMDPSHPNMSSREDASIESKREIYKDIDGYDDPVTFA